MRQTGFMYSLKKNKKKSAVRYETTGRNDKDASDDLVLSPCSRREAAARSCAYLSDNGQDVSKKSQVVPGEV